MLEYIVFKLADAGFWVVVIWSVAFALYFLFKSIIGYLLDNPIRKKPGVDDE